MISRTEYKVLKLFLKKPELTADEIESVVGEGGLAETMKALEGIITVANPDEALPIGVITDKASYLTSSSAPAVYTVINRNELNRAVEEYTRDIRRYLVTTAISAIALLISIVALLK